MSRRSFVPLLLILLLAATACAEPTRQVEPEQPPEPVVLKIAVADGWTDLQALIEAYQSQHTHVTFEKLPVDLSSPLTYAETIRKGDILPIDPHMARGDLLDLGFYLARDKVDKSAYSGGFEAALARTNGQELSVPYKLSGLMIPYNKELTEQAGVEIPAEGWTWDEFRLAAAKLAQRSPDGVRPALSYLALEQLVQLYIEQKTGEPSHLTDEKTLTEALSFFHTMINTDKSMSPAPRMGVQGGPGIEPNEAFNRGEAAFAVEPSALILPAGRPFAWDLAPMPYHRPEKRLTSGSFSYLGIGRKCPDPEVCWDFLAFAISPEGAKLIAKSGFLPAYRTPDWDRWLTEHYPQAPAALLTLYETKFIPFRSVDGNKAAALDRAINRVLSGTTSVEAAVADWKQDLGLQ
jgi:multiple sugar transport system substrate-binding protein